MLFSIPAGQTSMKKVYLSVGPLVALALLLAAASALALAVPRLEGRVNDYGDMLSPGAKSRLNVLLEDLERRDSTQIVVLTIPSLEGEDIEGFSIRVAEQWKIGHKGLDNGAILLISRADRSVRIEVGYGLEGKLTDLQAGRIISNAIVPEFRAGRFDQGVINGVSTMIDIVRGEYTASQKPASGERRGSLPVSLPVLVIFFIMLVSRLGRVSRLFGGLAGGVLAPVFGFMAFSPGLIGVILLAAGGLFFGLILSSVAGMLPAGSGSSRRGPLGGGGFGGWFPGGGGFSGGGGGFGGGGASGRW
jgi:uncharacterized protein